MFVSRVEILQVRLMVYVTCSVMLITSKGSLSFNAWSRALIPFTKTFSPLTIFPDLGTIKQLWIERSGQFWLQLIKSKWLLFNDSLRNIFDYEILKVSQRLTPEKSINNFNVGETDYRVQESISYYASQTVWLDHNVGKGQRGAIFTGTDVVHLLIQSFHHVPVSKSVGHK